MQEVSGLRQGAKTERHVVGQFVDLRSRQHVETDAYIQPRPPQRCGKACRSQEAAAVIDRRQALVGVFGVAGWAVAAEACIGRNGRIITPDLFRAVGREIPGEFRTAFDNNAAEFGDSSVNGHGNGFGCAPSEHADRCRRPARADLDQCCFLPIFGHGTVRITRLRAWPAWCKRELFHGISSGPSVLLVRGSLVASRRWRKLHATAANTSLTLSALNVRVPSGRLSGSEMSFAQKKPSIPATESDGAFNE